MRLLDREDDPLADRGLTSAKRGKKKPASKSKVRPLHICIFGDSQIGALKRSVDAGFERAEGHDIEYFGAPGPEFRQLYYIDGRIQPDADIAGIVETVNGGRRAVLDPAAFDAVVFFAARLRIREFLHHALHRRLDPARFISAAVRARTLEAVVQSSRFGRAALDMAARGHRVIFAVGPFLTEGVTEAPLRNTPRAAQASADDRDALWCEIEAYFAARGVTFLRQPDETVVGGCLTDGRFAVEGAAEIGDTVHKSPAYGRIVLDQVFDAIETMQKSSK